MRSRQDGSCRFQGGAIVIGIEDRETPLDNSPARNGSEVLQVGELPKYVCRDELLHCFGNLRGVRGCEVADVRVRGAVQTHTQRMNGGLTKCLNDKVLSR